MPVLKNRAKMSTSTTGTGTITLGSAEDGYQTFAAAGVANSDVVRYIIEDGSNFEIGTGTYTSSGTTLTRSVIESSSPNPPFSDSKINLSGSATVFIGATAEDIPALYAENYDDTSTLPSATGTNSVAIGREAESTGTNSIAIGRNATSNSGVALGYNTQASAFYGVAIGTNLAGSGALSSGFGAIALGASRANGSSSLSAMTDNNTASYGALGSYSIALGYYSKTTANKSFTLGSSCISGGEGSLATGLQTEASANYGRSGGYGSLANVSGDAWAGGYFSATGDAQNVKLVIRGATSNTTPVILTTGGGAASGSRSLILETYSAYAFSLMVVARRDASDGTESAAVKIEGLIRKESNDASITLVNSNITTISNAPSWTISVSATVGAAGEDNGGLDVVCADLVNGHNIRWVGTLKYTKVTYA